MEDSRDDIILDESEDAPITCNSMGCHKLMPDSNTSPEFQLSPPHLRFEKVLERMKKRPDGSERKHFRPEEVRSKRIRSLAESKRVSSSKVIDLPIKNIYLSLQRNFIANQAYSNR